MLRQEHKKSPYNIKGDGDDRAAAIQSLGLLLEHRQRERQHREEMLMVGVDDENCDEGTMSPKKSILKSTQIREWTEKRTSMNGGRKLAMDWNNNEQPPQLKTKNNNELATNNNNAVDSREVGKFQVKKGLRWKEGDPQQMMFSDGEEKMQWTVGEPFQCCTVCEGRIWAGDKSVVGAENNKSDAAIVAGGYGRREELLVHAACFQCATCGLDLVDEAEHRVFKREGRFYCHVHGPTALVAQQQQKAGGVKKKGDKNVEEETEQEEGKTNSGRTTTTRDHSNNWGGEQREWWERRTEEFNGNKSSSTFRYYGGGEGQQQQNGNVHLLGKTELIKGENSNKIWTAGDISKKNGSGELWTKKTTGPANNCLGNKTTTTATFQQYRQQKEERKEEEYNWANRHKAKNGKKENVSKVVGAEGGKVKRALNEKDGGDTDKLADRCVHCGIELSGSFVLAKGRAWCPEHFCCTNSACARPLLESGFVECANSRRNYCPKCYEVLIAPVCHKCSLPLTESCLNALGQKWHPDCFVCNHCRKPFGTSSFYVEKGKPYCEDDWNQLFTTKCDQCQQPIKVGQKWLEALGGSFHSECFRCTSCDTVLEGKTFFERDKRPYCRAHAINIQKQNNNVGKRW